MKTKREVLNVIAKQGNCAGMSCDVCPYHENLKRYQCNCINVFKRIGAMAILRMFKEKKKPTLSVGTKIKFSDGRIAIIKSSTRAGPELVFETINGYTSRSLSYLVGRTWEVVE